MSRQSGWRRGLRGGGDSVVADRKAGVAPVIKTPPVGIRFEHNGSGLTQDEIAAVETAVRTILDSGAFKNSERMCRFLQFAVEQAVREKRPKEYEIGLSVFDRGEDFDPREDTIVRVEARRLRAKLRQYYESEGADAPVVIDFPERGYTPAFRFRRTERASRLRKLLIVAVPVALLAALATMLVLWPRRNSPDRSIVVLPFVNLSPDPSNEYIGDGFTEEITNALVAMQDLRVVARTSAFRLRGSADDVQEIGRRLKVRWVLEGSVRKEADRLRVAAQLVDAETRLHVWSQAFDASLTGLFEVQERIAAEIARELKVGVLPPHRDRTRSRQVKPEAYEAYLKGRYFWYRLTPEAVRKSIFYLNQAVQIDPEYAAAYAALADSYSLLPQLELEPPGEDLDNCESAAERALALDANSPEAHFAAGIARAVAHRDPAGAEREFLRALELRPNLTAARQAYSVTSLSPMGRHDEAIAEMRRVVADDPVSPVARFALGEAMAYAGRVDEAVQELRVCLELEPGFLWASQAIAIAYLARSGYTEARLELERTWPAANGDPVQAALLGYTCGRLGDQAGAQRMLEHLTSRSRKYIPPLEVAGVYNGLGRTEEALRWLERAYLDRSPMLLWVAVDPRFASLRQETRFLTLIGRMGLAVRR